MDFGRPSAFSNGGFFMPLHLPTHSVPPTRGVASPPLHTYFTSLAGTPYLDSSTRVSLLSERLFGRLLVSPTGAGEELVEPIAVAKEDEVTSSESVPRQSATDTIALHKGYNQDAIFESAAKLLFMAVKFAKSIPSFSNLPLDDRTILIQESWADLFVLTCAQWNLVETSKCSVFVRT